MYKRLISCLLILLCGSVCAAQQKAAGDGRANQRRVEAVMSSMPGLFKAIDEPLIRVSLRLRAAKFLWADKSEAASRAAEQLTAEALEDIQEREGEIPPLYVKLLRREALASLQLRAPDLAARLVEKYKLGDRAGGFETAFELLGYEGGVSKAVEIMRSNVQSGSETSDSNLNFFLGRLDETQPQESNRLLADILAAAERAPNNYPISFLIGLAGNYLYRDATPAELKVRFLALFIRATSDPAALTTAERNSAHGLLKASLPLVEKHLPSLYARAGAQVAAFTPSRPTTTAERENAENNIRSSTDPLAQMMTEADRTGDTSLKRNLLESAARRALNEDRLKLAVELMMRFEPPGEVSEEDFVEYRDQFLGDVVRRAVAKKDREALAYTAEHIHDPLQRASALQRLALMWHEAGDVLRAREVLEQAFKLIESAKDRPRKATAFLNLATFFLKIDDARVPPTTQAAIKVINALPGPKQDVKADSAARKDYLDGLVGISSSLAVVFQRLAQKDEGGAFSLASRLERPELKASAMLGTLMGLPELEAEAPAKSN